MNDSFNNYPKDLHGENRPFTLPVRETKMKLH